MKKNKHILVISQYFYPEQFRINDICTEWVKRGYKVTVLTGIPNYPQGRYYEGYGLNKKRKETWNGVDIIRIPLIPRGQTPIGLVLNYFSFPISGWVWNLCNKIKADYVFMFEISPMTQCKIGVWYAKKHKIPLYLYVQDLWPENVEIITGIHNRCIIAPIQHMVDKIYKACEDIFVTSPSFAEAICKRGIKQDKVHYWPQYAEEFYYPRDKEKVTQISTENKFKIIFTGNIGYAQGLDILPKTAKILKEKNIKDVQFVIVGEGRYCEQLKKEIEDIKEMFIMIPKQPAQKIPELLTACDVAFLSFQDMALWKMTIPAKLQSYMACGMPIIASAEGETEKVITEAKCGISTPLGDSVKLADAIISIKNTDLSILRENSRKYFLSHFEKKHLMDEIELYFN
ncbi:MAG: glycosyltransferase family 4 protein [Blautia hansenii]|uniref:Putative glycosyl transferase n=1 Tax=Blautia hansenii TaxID=1322 RepID=A0A6N2RIX5_BLAHA